ncbi:Bardet-Biedl syndrome 2 protein homolog isoform X2 [Daktulosphaira vitifoliae]|uniref:Bardet-Biedl syndrome 2 protein homolog isoform X2 n=1 Tax=Daktulosphaira vitifoliae TaxID=58002 RepID=UPI0021AB03B3|nr:Bardet-Biedl syndrome 2 protein homolog isoform X2 [Daktulosphaira vitifoliae]
MATPLFSLQLKHNAIPGLVTIGKYDGSHHCLTLATTENKIPDGVGAVAIGKLGTMKNPSIIIGGNCAVQVFDYKGNEILWTVTGDNVRSIIVIDINLNGFNELLVGSDDYEIREFKDDRIVNEISETSPICSLNNLSIGRFAYALDNGTVGVYEKTRRVWRVKSKSSVTFLEKYDLDGDGKEELITGWSNGKIDARNSRTGEVVFRDALSSGIAGIVVGDYKRAGKCQLIVVSVTGEVRGYDSSSLKVESGVQNNVIHDLLQKRQILMAELKNYAKVSNKGNGIPGDTRLITELSVSEDMTPPCVLLTLLTNNSTILRAVTVFAEGIFDDETHVVHPKKENVSSTLTISLFPPKDIHLDIHIRAFVGSHVDNDQFHVFELTRVIPRFSMYLLIPILGTEHLPESYVKFQLVERVQRLDMWLSQNFIVPQTKTPIKTNGTDTWNILIKSFRDSSLTHLVFEKNTICIYTTNISLAADLVQSLASYLNIEQVESHAEFPQVLEDLWENIQLVKSLQQNSVTLNASIADNSALLKNLTVKAEDFRLLDDMLNMKTCLNEIYHVNRQMIQNHKVTCENHDELLKTLKKINTVIQNASRLRVSNSKSEMITAYRQAVASENMTVLKKLVETGNKE